MKSLTLLICFMSAFSFAGMQTDLLMKGHWGTKELLQWELLRLDKLKENLNVPFSKDSTLAKKISKDGKVKKSDLFKFLSEKQKLSEEELNELLGVLRLANTVSRIQLESNEEALKFLIKEELGSFPKEASKLNERELSVLLGKLRIENSKEKGPEFVSDLFQDRILDKALSKANKIASLLPKENFPKPVFQIPPAFNPPQPPRIIFQHPNGLLQDPRAIVSSPRNVPVNPGFTFEQTPQGSGGIFLNNGSLGNSVGKIQDPKILSSRLEKFSLIMKMSFQGENARCQTTVVQKEPVGDKCTYHAATAKHCIVNEENPSHKLTGLAIQDIGPIESVGVALDPSGHDFALMTFTTACADVPVVPLRKDRVRDQEEILVETVPGGTLVGRAKDAVSGESLMALDVRSPFNPPVGINPGDSGGGIATIGPDGKPELVGVISSKPVDGRLAGIGFFAAKSSMDWANELLSRPLLARNQSVSDEQPTHIQR